MMKFTMRLLVLSAVGVLLLPGNESHRDQVLRSLTSAYANAGDYCTHNRETCDKVVAQVRKTGLTLARQAVDFAETMAAEEVAAERPATGPSRYLQSGWRGIAQTASDVPYRR